MQPLKPSFASRIRPAIFLMCDTHSKSGPRYFLHDTQQYKVGRVLPIHKYFELDLIYRFSGVLQVAGLQFLLAVQPPWRPSDCRVQYGLEFFPARELHVWSIGFSHLGRFILIEYPVHVRGTDKLPAVSSLDTLFDAIGLPSMQFQQVIYCLIDQIIP